MMHLKHPNYDISSIMLELISSDFTVREVFEDRLICLLFRTAKF